MDRRGEASGDQGKAHGAGGGVDRRGETAELEVSELLTFLLRGGRADFVG